MGLFYSLMSYFYGPQETISAQNIRISAQKLSIRIDLMMKKLRVSNNKLENQFIEMVSKQQRDLFIQNVKINDMIMASIKYGGIFNVNSVYEELYKCSQRIKNQAHSIAQSPTKVSDECLKAIFAVVNLYKEFQLDGMIDLKEFIPQPYPVISIDKLEPTIRQYLKYKQPTEYERNVYVNEMIKRRQGEVSLEKLNKIPHAFCDSPEPLQEKRNFSTDLYARSASFQIPDQMQMDQFAA